jgi:hypothetical protein
MTSKVVETIKTVSIVVLLFTVFGLIGSQEYPETLEPQIIEVEKPVSVEVEKIVYQAPEACATLIDLDSATYRRLGDYFGSIDTSGSYLDFVESFGEESEKLNDFLTPRIDQRRALISECLTN